MGCRKALVSLGIICRQQCRAKEADFYFGRAFDYAASPSRRGDKEADGMILHMYELGEPHGLHPAERFAPWQRIQLGTMMSEARPDSDAPLKCQNTVPKKTKLSELDIGDRVLITGLKSTMGNALNGREGIISSHNTEIGRYGVQVQDVDAVKALKPDNLFKMLGSPDEEYGALIPEGFEDRVLESVSDKSMVDALGVVESLANQSHANAQVSNALLQTCGQDSKPCVILLKLSRNPRPLRDKQLAASDLQVCLGELEKHGMPFELESRAKMLVSPQHYEASLEAEALSMSVWRLRPEHIIVEPLLQDAVINIVESLPGSVSARCKSSNVIPFGFAAESHGMARRVVISKTFINIVLPSSIRSSDGTGPHTVSTTDMDSRKGKNHRNGLKK